MKFTLTLLFLLLSFKSYSDTMLVCSGLQKSSRAAAKIINQIISRNTSRTISKPKMNFNVARGIGYGVEICVTTSGTVDYIYKKVVCSKKVNNTKELSFQMNRLLNSVPHTRASDLEIITWLDGANYRAPLGVSGIEGCISID